MNTDWFYEIGHAHRICEDYATAGVMERAHAGNERIAYAIVSDGCSSSADVDVGCRLMATAAREVIYQNGFTGLASEFGYKVIRLAANIALPLRLSPNALDATLLVAMVRESRCRVMMFGDGVMIYRSKDKKTIRHVHYESNAPMYLSQRFILNAPAKAEDLLLTTEQGKTSMFTNTAVMEFEFHNISAGESISICSDGIGDFVHGDGTPMLWGPLVDEFTGFKSLKGVFVERRMQMFLRDCKKNGIVHNDDISIASIAYE